MKPADLFVGTVAVILGGVILLAALLQWPALYRLRSAERLTRLVGRTGACIFYALLGLIVLGLGIAIYCGWNIGPFRNPPR